MSEQALNTFFGTLAASEPLVGNTSRNNKHFPQTGLEENSFTTELSNSERELAFNNQISTLEGPDSSSMAPDEVDQLVAASSVPLNREELSRLMAAKPDMLTLEEVDQLISISPALLNSEGVDKLKEMILKELISKGMLPNRDVFYAQAKQMMGTGINNDFNYVFNGNSSASLAKAVKLNSGEISSFAESMKPFVEEIALLAKAMKANSGNSEEFSALAETLKANIEEISTLAKTIRSSGGNGEEFSALAKAIKTSVEEISTMAKTIKSSGGNSEELSTLAKAIKTSVEEISTMAKTIKTSGGNGEELSTLAKAIKTSVEEISIMAKTIRSSGGNGEELSTLAKAIKTSVEEISTMVKTIKASGGNSDEITSLVKTLKANIEEIASLAKTIKSSGGNSEELSALAKTMKHYSEEISSLAKALNKNSINVQGSGNNDDSGENLANMVKNPNKMTLGGATEKTANDPKLQQSKSQETQISGDKISLDSKGTANNAQEQSVSQHTSKNTFMESDKNQSRSESDKASYTSDAAKLQENVNNNNIKLEESIIQANRSNNSFLNNQTTDALKESNINITNIRQDIDAKVTFTNASRPININQPSEMLTNDIADNIIHRARLFVQGDKSAIRIQLNPPELGGLKLEFKVDDDTLSAKISVERAVVKDIIEKDIPRIRELLANSDVDVGKVDVTLQEEEDEKLAFADEGSQSDLEDQDLIDQDNENVEYEDDEDSVSDITGSNKINYIV